MVFQKSIDLKYEDKIIQSSGLELISMESYILTWPR